MAECWYHCLENVLALDVAAKVCSGSLSGFIDFVFSPEIPDASVFQMCLCR